MKGTVVLGNKCWSDPLGPCYSHTFYVVGLPLWLSKWFVRRFITSTCVRTGNIAPFARPSPLDSQQAPMEAGDRVPKNQKEKP